MSGNSSVLNALEQIADERGFYFVYEPSLSGIDQDVETDDVILTITHQVASYRVEPLRGSVFVVQKAKITLSELLSGPQLKSIRVDCLTVAPQFVEIQYWPRNYSWGMVMEIDESGKIVNFEEAEYLKLVHGDYQSVFSKMLRGLEGKIGRFKHSNNTVFP